ncbi:MAG: hypothetical protein OXK75_03375 [Gammaproteobacteria bacterium]|nr:hypothetical protein [Gammaproteobacteria bacterium]
MPKTKLNMARRFIPHLIYAVQKGTGRVLNSILTNIYLESLSALSICVPVNSDQLIKTSTYGKHWITVLVQSTFSYHIRHICNKHGKSEANQSLLHI